MVNDMLQMQLRQLRNFSVAYKWADSICTLFNSSPWYLEWRRYANKWKDSKDCDILFSTVSVYVAAEILPWDQAKLNTHQLKCHNPVEERLDKH